MSIFPSPALGGEIPPHTPHSVIFSIPKWHDNVELGRRNKTILDSLKTTYPRSIIHTFVEQARYIPYSILSFFLHDF